VAPKIVRWGLAWAASIGGMTPAVAQEAAKPTYGVVDVDRLIRETPGAAAADSVFQREFAQWQAQLGALEDSLRQMIGEYDRQQVTLTPEAKSRREQEILQKQGQYQQLEAELARRAENRRVELLSPIMRKIRGAVEQVRLDRNLSVIFNQQSAVAWDNTLDVTDAVIATLKAASEPAKKPD
jgi:outer membrane protein